MYQRSPIASSTLMAHEFVFHNAARRCYNRPKISSSTMALSKLPPRPSPISRIISTSCMKTESAGAADFDEAGAGKIDADGLVLLTERRMPEFDGQRTFIAVMRLQFLPTCHRP